VISATVVGVCRQYFHDAIVREISNRNLTWRISTTKQRTASQIKSPFVL